MKKLLVAALMVVSLTAFAQEQQRPDAQRAQRERLSPEQRNELLLKKLTLDLGLNVGQQKDMAKIIADQSAKRQAAMAARKANQDKGVKPSADERFAMKNQKLDEQIAMKEKVKKILTPDQMSKWESMQAEKREKMQHRAHRKGNKMPKPE